MIVDTAPTGHTLRLLAAPATVAAAAEALDELQAEHRIIRERLAGSSRPEAADRFIALLRQEAEDIAALIADLKDPSSLDIACTGVDAVISGVTAVATANKGRCRLIWAPYQDA